MFLCPKPMWRWSNNVRLSCDSPQSAHLLSSWSISPQLLNAHHIPCSFSCFFYMLYQMCQMMELPLQEYKKQQKYWALLWTRNQYRQKQSRVQMKNTCQKQLESCRNCCNNNKQENPHGKQFQGSPSEYTLQCKKVKSFVPWSESFIRVSELGI